MRRITAIISLCAFALLSIHTSAKERIFNIYPKNGGEPLCSINISEIGYIDIDEAEEKPEPIPEGNGTKDSPYNVSQAINATELTESSAKSYIAGYIVGWASENTHIENIHFGVPHAEDTGEWMAYTLVIADVPTETNRENCLIVSMGTTDAEKFRKQYNLVDNPGNLGLKIKVLGVLLSSGPDRILNSYISSIDSIETIE